MTRCHIPFSSNIFATQTHANRRSRLSHAKLKQSKRQKPTRKHSKHSTLEKSGSSSTKNASIRATSIPATQCIKGTVSHHGPRDTLTVSQFPELPPVQRVGQAKKSHKILSKDAPIDPNKKYLVRIGTCEFGGGVDSSTFSEVVDLRTPSPEPSCHKYPDASYRQLPTPPSSTTSSPCNNLPIARSTSPSPSTPSSIQPSWAVANAKGSYPVSETDLSDVGKVDDYEVIMQAIIKNAVKNRLDKLAINHVSSDADPIVGAAQSERSDADDEDELDASEIEPTSEPKITAPQATKIELSGNFKVVTPAALATTMPANTLCPSKSMAVVDSHPANNTLAMSCEVTSSSEDILTKPMPSTIDSFNRFLAYASQRGRQEESIVSRVLDNQVRSPSQSAEETKNVQCHVQDCGLCSAVTHIFHELHTRYAITGADEMSALTGLCGN